MIGHVKTGNVIHIERRKRWRDRRVSVDRRNAERILRAGYECRSGLSRRESDIKGELSEGEIWWRTHRHRDTDQES